MSRTEQVQTVEYRTLKFGFQDPEEDLNELASRGWEVVEPIERDGHTVMFLLERETNGGGRA